MDFKLLLASILCLILASNKQCTAQTDYFYYNTIEAQAGWQKSGSYSLGWNGRWDSGGGPQSFFKGSLWIPLNQHSVNVNIGGNYGVKLKEGSMFLRSGYTFYWGYSEKNGWSWSRFFLVGLQNQINTNFNQFDWRIMPELGLHAFGALYIKYGYAIPLSKKQFEHLGNHQISIGIAIPLL